MWYSLAMKWNIGYIYASVCPFTKQDEEMFGYKNDFHMTHTHNQIFHATHIYRQRYILNFVCVCCRPFVVRFLCKQSAEKEERQLHFALFIRLTSFYYYTFPSSLSIFHREQQAVQGQAGRLTMQQTNKLPCMSMQIMR